MGWRNARARPKRDFAPDSVIRTWTDENTFDVTDPASADTAVWLDSTTPRACAGGQHPGVNSRELPDPQQASP